ncbi:uncharacterized protein LOC110677740 isoform X2 [Aedes aegypti]|uniref:Uncharacterized protein n=1 Tax=Aedes aegypti TaxID=7159 RepID=A0A6I8U9K2_AEDAE|nr:uncharacterized protein LOC110677740 isoform X2 [Aedes aegypti]
MVAGIRGDWFRLKLLFSPKIAEIRQFCSNEGPAGDCFWLLDMFLLLSGIRSNATSKWIGERTVRYSVNVFHTMKASGLFVAGAKVSLVAYFETSIANVRNIVAGNRIFSGDDTYDKLEQKQFNQSARKMMRVLYALLIIDAIFLCIPCAATKKLFTLPPPLLRAGPFLSSVLYVSSAQLLVLGAVPKFFSNMACIGTLIIGMRMRLKILAHRWECILNYPIESLKFYFERMDREVRTVVDQQMEYCRQLQTLKNLVEKSFFIVHYYSLYSIGSCFFVARELGLNVLTGVIYASVFAYLLKHYLWCHLVDSLQDVADTIGDVIYVHCAQMPYSREYHAQYVQLKASLMIIWFNTINGVSIQCMGMLNISTATFVDLINIIYSVLTFLINLA